MLQGGSGFEASGEGSNDKPKGAPREGGRKKILQKFGGFIILGVIFRFLEAKVSKIFSGRGAGSQ